MYITRLGNRIFPNEKLIYKYDDFHCLHFYRKRPTLPPYQVHFLGFVCVSELESVKGFQLGFCLVLVRGQSF